MARLRIAIADEDLVVQISHTTTVLRIFLQPPLSVLTETRKGVTPHRMPLAAFGTRLPEKHRVPKVAVEPAAGASDVNLTVITTHLPHVHDLRHAGTRSMNSTPMKDFGLSTRPIASAIGGACSTICFMRLRIGMAYAGWQPAFGFLLSAQERKRIA